MKTKWFIFVFCLCSFVGLALAQQRTSETDPRFKRFLAQYPKADKNKDGILTVAEWRADSKDPDSQTGQSRVRQIHRNGEKLGATRPSIL